MSRSTTNWIFVTPLVIAVLWLIKPSLVGNQMIDNWIDSLGVFLCILGLIVRVIARDWKACRSHAGLVTTGPYSIVRHPMYVASYLSGIGLCAIIGSLYFAIGYTVLYILVHMIVARKEERFLRKTFQDEYKAYKARVPAVLPSPIRLIKKMMTRRPWVSSVKIAILREIGTICGFLAGIIMLQIRETYYIYHWHARVELIVWIAFGIINVGVWTFYTIKKPQIDPVTA